MQLFDGLDSIPNPFSETTVAIGTFDGVHVGHQAIIHTAVEEAHRAQQPALVFTFDRHPRELLTPDQAPDYLTTPEQRNRLISSLGADSLIVAHFDTWLSQLTPDAFVGSILKERLGAKTVVVGNNFCFGRNRVGDIAYLTEAQAHFDFRLIALDAVHVGGLPASSTRIRERLKAGEIAEAEEVLGHPYLLSGKIVSGQRLGRTLGYPTANLALTVRQAVPLDGIYAVWAYLQDGRKVPGACSIGNRPTVEGAGRSIETFLLDFNEDLYGQTMELQFVRHLRHEQKFESLDALVVQIGRDVEQVRSLLTEA